MIIINATFTVQPIKLYIDELLSILHLDDQLVLTPPDQFLPELLNVNSVTSQNNSINIFMIRLEDLVPASQSIQNLKDIADAKID